MNGEVELFNAAVSTLQNNVAVNGTNITGELLYKENYTGFSSKVEEQSGNFLALQWSAPADGVTSLKVGLDPSYAGGLVEVINDPDHNGVFRIHDTSQKFKVVQTKGDEVHTQTFNLSGLILDSETEG